MGNKWKKKHPNIVAVDDEELILKALKRTLRKAGFTVLTSSSAAEALDLFRDSEIALVVSDYKMPGMSGVEFLEQVRTISPDTVRILLTGYAELEVAEDAINRAGVFQFLVKPWDDTALKNVIQSGLKQFELKKENVRLLEELQEKNRELEVFNRNLEEKVEERTRQLKDSQSQLFQAEKMASLGFFASGIAHEINNPLCTILANTQLLLQVRENGDEGKEELREIEHACLRGRNIVRAMQTFARPESVEGEVQITDLTSEIRRIFPLVKTAGKFRGFKVTVTNGEGPIYVLTNPKKLAQILVSLLTNAVQASTENGRVEIAVAQSGDPGMVELAIRDNGPGIPRDVLPHIFDPFFTTREPGEGMGMGLAISYELARSMGGRIEVESKPGEGSCFRIFLQEAKDE